MSDHQTQKPTEHEQQVAQEARELVDRKDWAALERLTNVERTRRDVERFRKEGGR